MRWYRFFSVTLLLGLAALLAGCGGDDRKSVAIAAKDSTIRTQEGQIAQAESDKKELGDMNQKLADQNQQILEKTVTATEETKAQVEATKAQVAEMEALMKTLDAKRAASGEGTSVSQSTKGIHITVASTEFFEPGKAELKKNSHALLMKVAHVLKTKYAKNFVRIEGHTDSTPVVVSKNKFPDNMALSLARARAVYDFLVKEGGISSSRLYTAGYGEHQPLVYPEKTAADRAKNRRVEIVIMPSNIPVHKDRMEAPVAASKPVPQTNVNK